MPPSITYNTGRNNVTHVFRAINGGVDFSANLVGTAFDYFLDAPTADDAIYFILSGWTKGASLEIDPAVAMAGTDIVLVWEYFANWAGDVWRTIPRLTDNTAALTVTGANVLVDFPYPPFQFYVSVNSVVSACVVRCRLVSFTAVTEGGANTDGTPQFGDGFIRVNDYTEEAPATLADVYDYMDATYPDVEMTRFDENEDVFLLPHATIWGGNGYWRMENSVLKLGNGGGQIALDIRKLTDGTKIGTDKSKDGSLILYCAYIGALGFQSSVETKLYGTMVNAGTYKETMGGTLYSYEGDCFFAAGYGEYIGVQISGLRTGYFSSPLTMRNVFMETDFNVTYPFLAGAVLENVHLYYDAAPAHALLNLYSGAGTGELKGLSWYIPSGWLFCGFSLAGDTYTFNFLNPSPAFPDIGGTPNYFRDAHRDYDKDWHIYERYTFDLTVVDESGDPIEAVTVTAKDKNGSQAFSVTTDENGQIAQQKLLKSHGYYDGGVKKDEYNPYTVILIKGNYATRTIPYTMDRAREEIEMLEVGRRRPRIRWHGV